MAEVRFAHGNAKATRAHHKRMSGATLENPYPEVDMLQEMYDELRYKGHPSQLQREYEGWLADVATVHNVNIAMLRQSVERTQEERKKELEMLDKARRDKINARAKVLRARKRKASARVTPKPAAEFGSSVKTAKAVVKPAAKAKKPPMRYVTVAEEFQRRTLRTMNYLRKKGKATYYPKQRVWVTTEKIGVKHGG